MQIQEYNIHIQHLRGAESFLEDRVSWNAVGFCERDGKELFKPKDSLVAAINRSIDISVGGSVKELLTSKLVKKESKK